jgi:hypothetical protein
MPTFLWDDRVWRLGYHKEHLCIEFNRRHTQSDVLATIRLWLLRRWWRNLRRSLWSYMRDSYGEDWVTTAPSEEVYVGRDALYRCAGANWWEWCEGSMLFFWRWPVYVQKLALEGHPPWFMEDPPRYKVP